MSSSLVFVLVVTFALVVAITVFVLVVTSALGVAVFVSVLVVTSALLLTFVVLRLEPHVGR